jgi:hypothetical protein
VIDDSFVQDVKGQISRLNSDHPVVQAHERLRDAIASGEISEILSVAKEGVETVATNPDLAAVVSMTRSGWTGKDSKSEQRTRVEIGEDELFAAEYDVLRESGVSPGAGIALIIDAMSVAPLTGPPVDYETMVDGTRMLEEELKQERLRQDIREVKNKGLFRRIGRAVHVVGGSVLMLADVGSATALVVANPLVAVGSTPLVLVSLKKGSDIIRTGIHDL